MVSMLPNLCARCQFAEIVDKNWCSLYKGTCCKDSARSVEHDMNEDENEIFDYQGDLDPDKCYFNQYSDRLIKNCNYFLEESFKKYLAHHHITNKAFSMLHLNVRSIPANLSAFQSYLNTLEHHFSIIGLTETWLKPLNVSVYGIEGYNHVGITRENTKGGGVSLIISQEFVYSEMNDLCQRRHKWVAHYRRILMSALLNY